MPYELSLAPDQDRGGSRYRIAVTGDLTPGVVRQLSDWLGHAMQNPAASFEIDLTDSARSSPRARLELASLMRRHRSLLTERRLFVVTPRRARRRMSGAAVARGSASVPALVDSLAGAVPL